MKLDKNFKQLKVTTLKLQHYSDFSDSSDSLLIEHVEKYPTSSSVGSWEGKNQMTFRGEARTSLQTGWLAL